MNPTLAQPREHTTRTSGPPDAVQSPSETRHVRLTVRDDHVGVLTFDRPGSSANVFDVRTLQELENELAFIERQTELKGLVFVSAKPSIFIAGLDLTLLRGDTTESQAREILERGQTAITRIARLRIPTVAAIHGAAIGGGFEMCLACDYRVASPDRVTRIGLPETSLGLLPAWGGATRLPRLIGLPGALDIILPGKTLKAGQALKAGLVDELVPAETRVDAAARWIHSGGVRRSPHAVLNHPPISTLIGWRARVASMRRTRGHYPAVLKALDVVTRGLRAPMAESLRLEREGILELIQTPACRNLLRMFHLQNRARKLDVAGEVVGDVKPVRRTAVVGAGVMGAGIAQWMSARGLPVILRDLDAARVAQGLSRIAQLYRQGTRHHVFTALEARDGLDRIQPAPTEVPLHHVDLVLEAAVEDMELKKKVFARLADQTSGQTILATNTSALSVSELAGAVRRPERVVGLHFFNPVHRMPLVEVVAARQTSPETLRRALRFVQGIGKLPVLVKDSPGFLVNRILMPYLVEAGHLFGQGASAADLDAAMLEFGMPMGPMRLLDEVGLDVALHVARTLSLHFGDRLRVPGNLEQMVAAGALGCKTGCGYYRYGKSGRPAPNREALAFVEGSTAAALPRATLQQRMVLLMVNEAARCLEEHLVEDPADVDLAMIMGTGFAPFHGGPLRYADAMSASRLVEAMHHHVASGAAHFTPCTLLARMAETGGTFHPKGGV